METARNDTADRFGQVPPPEGVMPDFDHPKDAGWKLNIIVLAICNALVTIFFLLRCYVKIFVNRRINLADWACLMAWVLILLYGATLFVMAHYGLGYHAWEVTVEDFSEVLKWLYVSSVVYNPAAYFTKVALLLLIAHVFAVKERVARGIHIFIWALLFAYTPIQTIKITICVPISAYWDPILPNSHCLNRRKVFISDLALAVLADFVILLVPIPLTWSLQLPLRKKIKIILMLGAGGIATAVAMFRLVKVIMFLDSDDVTADFVAVDLATYIELTIGFVCACLPAVHLLVEHWSGRKHSQRSNTPRTGRWDIWPNINPKGKRISNWWDTVTKKKRTEDMAVATLCADAPTTEVGRDNGDVCNVANPPMRFDLELAMFTGQSKNPASDDAIELQSRVHSMDRRREGGLPRRGKGESKKPGSEGHEDTIWDETGDDVPDASDTRAINTRDV